MEKTHASSSFLLGFMAYAFPLTARPVRESSRSLQKKMGSLWDDQVNIFGDFRKSYETVVHEREPLHNIESLDLSACYLRREFKEKGEDNG